MKTIRRKIGINRGKARLWIEGADLQSMGWVKGREFTLAFNATGLEFSAMGPFQGRTRKVAGTPERPILDTNTDKLLASLGCAVGDYVEIEIGTDRITVQPLSVEGRAAA